MTHSPHHKGSITFVCILIVCCCLPTAIGSPHKTNRHKDPHLRFVSGLDAHTLGAAVGGYDGSFLSPAMRSELDSLQTAMQRAQQSRNEQLSRVATERQTAFNNLEAQRDTLQRKYAVDEATFRQIQDDIQNNKNAYTAALNDQLSAAKNNLKSVQSQLAQLLQTIAEIKAASDAAVARIKSEADNQIKIIDDKDARLIQQHNGRIEELEKIAHSTTARLMSALEELDAKHKALLESTASAQQTTQRDTAELADVNAAIEEKKQLTEKKVAELKEAGVRAVAEGEAEKELIAKEVAQLQQNVVEMKIFADKLVKTTREETDIAMQKLKVKYAEMQDALNQQAANAQGMIQQSHQQVEAAKQREADSKNSIISVKAQVQQTNLARDAAKLKFEDDSHKLQSQIADLTARIGPMLKRIEESQAALRSAEEKEKQMKAAAEQAASAAVAVEGQSKDARSAVNAEAEQARTAALSVTLEAEKAKRKQAAAVKEAKEAEREAQKKVEAMQREAQQAQDEAERAEAAALSAASQQQKVAGELGKQLSEHEQELARKAQEETAALDRRNNEAVNQADSLSQTSDNLMVQQAALDKDIADAVNRTAQEIFVTSQLQAEQVKIEDDIRQETAASAMKRRELQSSLAALSDAKKLEEAASSREEEKLNAAAAENEQLDGSISKTLDAQNEKDMDISKTAAAMDDIRKQTEDLRVLMTQAARTAGAGEAALGALQAIADVAQQMQADVERIRVEKDGFSAALDTARQRLKTKEVRKAAMEGEILEMKNRLGLATEQESVSSAGKDRGSVAYEKLQQEKSRLLREIQDVENELDIIRDGGQPGPATLKRLAERQTAGISAASSAGNATVNASGGAAPKPVTFPQAPPPRLAVGARVRISEVTGKVVPDDYQGSDPTFWGVVSDVVTLK